MSVGFTLALSACNGVDRIKVVSSNSQTQKWNKKKLQRDPYDIEVFTDGLNTISNVALNAHCIIKSENPDALTKLRKDPVVIVQVEDQNGMFVWKTQKHPSLDPQSGQVSIMVRGLNYNRSVSEDERLRVGSYKASLVFELGTVSFTVDDIRFAVEQKRPH